MSTLSMPVDLRVLPTNGPAQKVHPKRQRCRILLTSVFGPYAQDDEYGSRRLNPMELYHNQVTRQQGPFSLRMFHRSWGLMLIQANVEAPCTLLDFPTLHRFVKEIRSHRYDVIGIGAIMPNVKKVQVMCRLIREHAPQATIVVGGHVAGLPDLKERVDADHVVRGEGVRWFRNFLGQDPDQPIRHPLIESGFGMRCMGLNTQGKRGETAATLIPSVGCPMGCNFCCTSAMFGGKGKFINFYETGDALFDVMCKIERALDVQSFFIMDENFLLYRKRALRLLELMQRYDKPWALYVFSSANVLRSYSIEQLVALGISWVWMGLEGKDSKYGKLKGADTLSLVKLLQAHGICVLGSTIIGMEEHTPENIDEVIDHAVAHDTEFHQFMLYTPFPGTALGAELRARGTLLEASECPEADVHGQLRFNYRHPHIKDGQETEFLVRAFGRDFEVNGPSVLRVVQTRLRGWQRYKNHPDGRVRARYASEATSLATTFAAALWAARDWFRGNSALVRRLDVTLHEIYREFGATPRLVGPLVGRFIRWSLRREEKRLQRGQTYEPPTFYETNYDAGELIPMGVCPSNRTAAC